MTNEPTVKRLGNEPTGTLATIQKWLGAKWSAAANVIKSLGPTIMSAAPAMSENYLTYKAASDALDLAKEAARAEQRILSEARGEILVGVASASPSELVAIKQRLDFLDEQTRTTIIHLRALERLEEKTHANRTTETGALPNSAEPTPIADHWTDHFNRLARLRNEPWRTELLARALASESESPGSISVRALWTIGTLETAGFEVYAAYLDTCIRIGDSYILPTDGLDFQAILPNLVANDTCTIGNMLFQIDALGLIGDIGHASHIITVRKPKLCTYGSTSVTVEPTANRLEITGAIANPIGREIGSLYDQVSNSIGQSVFDKWMAKLPQENCIITPVPKRTA